VRRRHVALVCVATLLTAGGCRKDEPADPAAIATTSSYAECLARELLGPAEPIFRLSGPGMCPGHFDILPSQASQLRGCRVLVRFDFQKSLDERLSNLVEGGLQIISLKVPDGLCRPQSYLAGCRQLAEALVAAGLVDKAQADARLADLRKRMDQLADWADQQVRRAGLRGRPVLASGHQAAFCRSLGLNVVATFSAADSALPREIDRAAEAGRKAGVRMVIANLPEGRRLADSLAERVGADVVVFANFPEPNRKHAFDELVRSNVTQLISAGQP